MKEELRALGAEVIRQEEGCGRGRRQVIRAALKKNTQVIVWIEPEKYTLISELEKITKEILRGKADIVIPKRKSIDSYPKYQQYIELFGNDFWSIVTGTNLDVWFGPRAFSRQCAEYFLQYDGKEYGDMWDSINNPLIDAIIDKKKILSVEIDFEYPEEQRDYEEGKIDFYERRIIQLNNLTSSIKDYWLKKSQN